MAYLGAHEGVVMCLAIMMFTGNFLWTLQECQMNMGTLFII